MLVNKSKESLLQAAVWNLKWTLRCTSCKWSHETEDHDVAAHEVMEHIAHNASHKVIILVEL